MMSTTITFEAQGLPELIDRVNKAGDTVTRISINEGLRRLGRLVTPHLKMETPKRTGRLQNSTVFQIVGGPRQQMLEFRQAARSDLGLFYGMFVREGRGPVHAINAQALHFWIGDVEFFRKSVGPAKPNPYHRRVIVRLRRQIQKIVTEMGERVCAYIAGNAT